MPLPRRTAHRHEMRLGAGWAVLLSLLAWALIALVIVRLLF
jgi:hypothetical protein